jgi:DNA-binding MarR family transcriptional regulator
MSNETNPTRPTRRFDSLEQEAYLAMWRTYDRMRSIEDELFVPWEITAQQYNVLRLLRADHPNPVPTLSLVGRLISRAPDITRMLDKLETRHWITRTRSETDRRTVLVGITPEGLDLLEQLTGPLKLCHERQLGHLSQESLRKLINLLGFARAPHESEDSAWRVEGPTEE